ncbi:MAG: long-chain fatty acid--CoA ligase [Chromatiales bacterium]|jgi:long-chain acyl-CoA synthetase
MQTIAERFRETAAARPNHPLVVTAETSLSFSDIDGRSDAVAAWLAARGHTAGDRIGLYCINCPEFVCAYLGIVKAGAVVVPVNVLLNAAEIAYVLSDAGARTLIYHQALEQGVRALGGGLRDLQCLVRIGEGPGARDEVAFDELLGCADGPPALALRAREDLAVILYTSGTTGHPKGAMLTHANLVSNTSSVMEALRMDPGRDRLLVVLPMFHAFAATVGMLTPALHGLSLVPVPRFDPGLVSEAIDRTRASVFLGVPSMYNLLLRQSDEKAALWAPVRFAVSGGAAMPVELMRRFEARYGFPVLEGDGPTECSPVTCVNPRHGVRKPGSVGMAIPDVQIEIRDERGGPLPDGQIGEICVRGPNVMRGYWRQPQATAEAFFDDWLRTGDLGYRDGDGYIFIVDRRKDLIIVNGMNVYPRVVEEVLHRDPRVAEAAVVGEPDDLHGEVVVAHVVPAEGERLGDADVKALCRAHLGRHEVPRRVIIRDALPKNATGKVLKRELRMHGEIERGVDSRP